MITKFSEFKGNPQTLQSISRLLEQGRMPAAVILEGPAGSGRNNLAHLIAAGLLCENGHPCGECNSCRKVFFTGHPDVTVVLPEKKKANISVEQIRVVRTDAFVRAVEGKAKLYIIGGSMNVAAQNALLKVLEEPPAGVYFIVICNHRNELLETVISRGTVFSLEEGEAEQANPHLVQAEEIALEMATALSGGSRSGFLAATAKAAGERLLHAPVLERFYAILHHALMSKTGLVSESVSANEIASLLCRRFTKERLLQMAEIVRAQEKKINYNVNGNLFFTALCSELMPRS